MLHMIDISGHSCAKKREKVTNIVVFAVVLTIYNVIFYEI